MYKDLPTNAIPEPGDEVLYNGVWKPRDYVTHPEGLPSRRPNLQNVMTVIYNIRSNLDVPTTDPGFMKYQLTFIRRALA